MKALKYALLLIPVTALIFGIAYVCLSLNLIKDLLPTVSVYGVIVISYFAVRFLFHIWNKPFTTPFSISTSIVLPVYQENPEVFMKCLKSCLSQNPSEIIVVDDGSKDLTNYYNASALKKDNPNLVVLRQEKNRGKRHAQAVAFKIAKGDILATIDSDTVLEKDALKELLKPFIDPKI
jgi:hyaluronan synthase